MNGLFAAFGDFDFDRITDVFLITERGKSVQLAKGFTETEPYLQKWPNIGCSFDNTSGDRIVGVIPFDFTGNTFLDLLVVTQDINSNFNKRFKLWLFKGNKTNLECNTTVPLVQNIKSFPFILDFDGDMITDFIVETNDCSKELWIRLRPTCLQELKSNQSMKYPNSNAFIDLSHPKDFTSDLYISGIDSIEYWFNKNGFNRKNKLQIHYPNENIYKFVGQSAFADINFDGIIEHLIPVCKSDIHTCTEPQILVLTYNGSDYEWIEVLEYENELNLTFIQTKIFDYLDFFVTLRVGDIDSDGFPDFVTLMREQNSTKTRAVWLKNCYSDTNRFGRIFKIDWTSDDIQSESTEDEKNIFLVSIFDFNEDGKLDLIIGSHDSNDSLSLSAYKNTGSSSDNFLKVLVTTGICAADCPQIGAALSGPFLCYSPSEGKHVTCAGQLSQSAHFALQLPFVLFGLGDVSNFIENLTVSIPSGQMKPRMNTWYEMIPDSRIIVIPYPANDTDSWVQKLYLDPKYFAFPTLIALTTICCLLVLIIAILHKRDLRQDILEHKEYKKHWL